MAKFGPSSGGSLIDDCLDCPVGRSGAIDGSSDSDDCPLCMPGSYSPSVGQLSCTNCSIDTIQSVAGQFFCSPCPFGSCTNNSEGQTSCVNCSNLYDITSVFGCVDNIGDGSTSDCPTVCY